MPLRSPFRPAVPLVVAFALCLAVTDPSHRAATAAQMPPTSAPECAAPPPSAVVGGTQDPALAQALQAIAQTIAAARAGGNLPGISVAIVQDQSVLLAGGFGCADVGRGIPATADTVYRVASNTKLFTATMMMQLRDRGLFALGDRVGQYVPEVSYTAQGTTVSPTFLQLASYSAGLPNYASPVTPQTVAELFTQLQSVHTPTEPGTEYIYSDLGFSVLGQALAIIAGQPDAYEQYVTDTILAPLGMTGSGFDPSGMIGAQFATGYSALGPAWSSVPYVSRAAFDPGGGLLSSAADMAKFLILQFRTGAAGGSQVLSCASLQEMWQPVIATNDGSEADLAWFTVPFGQQPLLSKNGVLPGFTNQISVLPNLRIGVITLANVTNTLLTGPARLSNLNAAIVNALIPALGPNPPGAPICAGS